MYAKIANAKGQKKYNRVQNKVVSNMDKNKKKMTKRHLSV